MEFDRVWAVIQRHAGESFYQLGGTTFTYQADAESLRPSTTQEPIPRSQFERLYALGTIPNPRQLRQMGISSAAVIFSILTDPRIQKSS